jgi:L-ascorbate metabolism protein UlaG (beta-lactamase superfamily)
MVNEPPTSSGTRTAKARRFLDRWKKPQGENRVGLLPAEGWRERNLNFIKGVLLPNLLSKRAPGHEVDPIPNAASDQVAVTWLGHAGFLVQIDGCNVLIDPNWALWHGPVKRYRHPSLYAHDLPDIDLVLITHAHFDHLHLPSLKRIAKGQPIVLPRGCGSLVRKLNFASVTELSSWGSVTFRDLTVTLTPARHWGARYIHDTHREFGGYLIESCDRTVYHCGDSAMFDGFAEIGERAPIDIALMPIGAYDPPSGRPVHMNYDTFPISGEPVHEPAERLQRAAAERALTDRVQILREGETLLM